MMTDDLEGPFEIMVRISLYEKDGGDHMMVLLTMMI